MARATGPLMSMDASGTIGKTITYSKWKGRNYVRRWVIPHNPQSALQISTRAMMTFLSQAWAGISAPDKDSWSAFAESLKVSTFNAFIRSNQKAFGNFDPIYSATPAARIETPDAVTSVADAVDGKLATITLTLATFLTTWGALLCVQPTSIIASSRSTVIKVPPIGGTVTTHQIGPFKPGTYGYLMRPFTADGVWGADSTPGTFTIV